VLLLSEWVDKEQSHGAFLIQWALSVGVVQNDLPVEIF
jgi:hypothetical protein